MQTKRMPPRRNPKKRVVQKGTTLSPEVKAARRAMKKERLVKSLRLEGDKQAIHGLGTDSRAAVNRVPRKHNNEFVDPTSNGTVKQIVVCKVESLYSVVIGLVSGALKRGWMASTTDVSFLSPEFPYYAAVRLVQILIAFMGGSTPELTQAPQWVWEFIYAIKPKTVQEKTGRISYTWNVTSGGATVTSAHVMPSIVLVSSNGSSQNNVVFGAVTGTGINGFPELIPAGAYSADDGDRALQSLFQVFGPEELMPDPGQDKMVCATDASAFAAVYPEMGVSSLSPGGISSTHYNETFITSPLFAKFALYQSAVTGAWRGWNAAGVSSGSGAYVLLRMLELSRPSHIRNKLRPRFKTYNFDEFYDVLARSVGLAMETSGKEAPGPGSVIPTCPLTPLRVQLILRQALLSIFENEFGQDLFYDEGPDAQTIPWFPFSVCQNGSNLASQGAQMRLPTVLVENIRACMRHTERVSARTGSTIADVIPLLGRYDPAVFPQLGNYTYDLGGVPTNVFTVEDAAPFSLIDLSYTSGGTTHYFDANADQYAVLVEMWNDWVVQINTLVGLSTISGEPGISALSTAFLTNHLVYDPPEIELSPPGQLLLAKNESKTASSGHGQASTVVTTVATVAQKSSKLKKEPSRKMLGTAHSRRRVKAVIPEGGSNYFDTMFVRLTSATYPFLTPTAKFMNCFIIPCQTAFQLADQENTISSIQTFQIEPFSRSDVEGRSNFTSGGDPTFLQPRPALSTRHSTLAMMNVRGPLSQSSEVMDELKQLALEGRGAFFTWIARAIQGVTGLPVAGIGSAVDTALGS